MRRGERDRLRILISSSVVEKKCSDERMEGVPVGKVGLCISDASTKTLHVNSSEIELESQGRCLSTELH